MEVLDVSGTVEGFLGDGLCGGVRAVDEFGSRLCGGEGFLCLGGRNARLSPARRHLLCLLEQILHPRVRSSIGAPQPVHVFITIPFPRRGGSSQSWRPAYAAGSASPH